MVSVQEVLDFGPDTTNTANDEIQYTASGSSLLVVLHSATLAL